MKRLVLVAGALALVAAGAFAAATEEGAAADTIYDVRVFYEFSKDRLPQQHPYHATLAEDKFGLRFEYGVAGGSTVEKTDLLFAAGDYYDMHPYGLRGQSLMDGHIVPLSITVPNYRKWWPRVGTVLLPTARCTCCCPRTRAPSAAASCTGRIWSRTPAWSGRPPSTGTPRCSGR